VALALESEARRAHLVELSGIWAGCRDCRLAESRTQVVVGDGNPAADLMFIGEAPGFHEDAQGVPFVGQAGKLLDELLAGIGLTRADCYIANVLKCRPPGNRDPLEDEIDACRGKLVRQVELIRPRVIATLGNFATKLLSGRPLGVTRVHGQARRTCVGEHPTVLYPLYHPAAALYNARLRPELEADIGRIPALLRHLDGLDGRAAEPDPEAREQAEPSDAEPAAVGGEQLGLF
jgi:DNA polymerase